MASRPRRPMTFSDAHSGSPEASPTQIWVMEPICSLVLSTAVLPIHVSASSMLVIHAPGRSGGRSAAAPGRGRTHVAVAANDGSLLGGFYEAGPKLGWPARTVRRQILMPPKPGLVTSR